MEVGILATQSGSGGAWTAAWATVSERPRDASSLSSAQGLPDVQFGPKEHDKRTRTKPWPGGRVQAWVVKGGAQGIGRDILQGGLQK